MTNSKNMQDLITAVARDTALTEDQSAAAVSSTLRYLTARLPSPVVGQLHESLQLNQVRPAADGSAAADLNTMENKNQNR